MTQPLRGHVVLYRRWWDGEVSAIFPRVPVGPEGHLLRYDADGIPRAETRRWLERYTRRATPEEYAALDRQLRTLGLDLVVMQRFANSTRPFMRRKRRP